MYRTILFDLDGTLLEHLPAIHRSYCHTLPQLGHPAPTYAQVRRAIGGGLAKAMRNFVSEAELPRALEIYNAYWDKNMLDGVELMPGAADLLHSLFERGCTLAVFTNKHGPSSRRVCEHLGVARYFKLIVGAGDTPWLKPDPKFADHVLTQLGGDRATTCLIGDSPFDVQAGHNGGFACFVVTTGTHNAEELTAARADGVFPDLTALGAGVFTQPA